MPCHWAFSGPLPPWIPGSLHWPVCYAALGGSASARRRPTHTQETVPVPEATAELRTQARPSDTAELGSARYSRRARVILLNREAEFIHFDSGEGFEEGLIKERLFERRFEAGMGAGRGDQRAF